MTAGLCFVGGGGGGGDGSEAEGENIGMKALEVKILEVKEVNSLEVNALVRGKIYEPCRTGLIVTSQFGRKTIGSDTISPTDALYY